MNRAFRRELRRQGFVNDVSDDDAAATLDNGYGPSAIHAGMLSSPAYDRDMDPEDEYEDGEPV